LGYQVAPFDLDASGAPVPDLHLATVVDGDTWTTMAWAGGNEALYSRRVAVRPVWSYGADNLSHFYGQWSPLGTSVGTSVSPADLTYNTATGILSWPAVDVSSWGQAQLLGYLVERVDPVPGPLADNGPEVTSFDLSTNGGGTYRVRTHFRRPDGTEGYSTGRLWPTLTVVPPTVLADTSDQLPGDPVYDAGKTQGRYTNLAADNYRPGWLASGYAGASAIVFVGRHLASGSLDENFGPLLGAVTRGVFYHPHVVGGGVYFGDSIGLVQDPSSGAIDLNGYLQNGVGNDVFQQYSFQGLMEPSYGGGAGTLQYSFSVPVGRMARQGTSGSVYSLEWYGDSTYLVRKLAFDGSTSVAGPGLGNTYLHRIAVQSDGKLIAVGQSGLVERLGTDLNHDSGWGSGGALTVTVDSVQPDWKDLVIDASDHIYLTGVSGTTGYIVRLLPNGTLDTLFNLQGYIALPGLYPFDLAVSSAGAVAVVGDTQPNEALGGEAFLKVFTSAGLEDPYIDRVLPGTTPWGSGARAVDFDANGGLMVAGFSRNTADPANTTPALWRF
jgi:hypothetical protein